MSIFTRAALAASLVIAATAAQAQQTGGANAIGVDHAASVQAQTAPAHPRVIDTRTGLSGGATAIGVDEADPAQAARARARAYAAPTTRGAAAATSGAKPIGSDN